MFCRPATMLWLRLFRVLSTNERLAWYKHDKLTLYSMSVRWKSQYLGKGSMNDRCDLMGLLEDYDDLNCADEEDHLFAISGLAIDRAMCTDPRHGPAKDREIHDGTCMRQIEVNYGRSTQAIYMDAVARLIIANSTNASRILAMIASRSPVEKTPGPSWSLDWRLPRVRTSLWIDRKVHFNGAFGDSQIVKASPKDARFLILCDDLAAWGKVATMFEPSPGSHTDKQVMDWLRKTWEDILRWFHSHNHGIVSPPAKQHLLLEQLLDAIFVLPHDLSNWDYPLFEEVNASIRSYVTFDLYLQLNGEEAKSSEEMDEMHDLDDDEEFIALTILNEMPTMVQRILRGRSVCILDPLTYRSALVGDGMLWPGLGIVPSHARPGDVVVALNGLESPTQRPSELCSAGGHGGVQPAVCCWRRKLHDACTGERCVRSAQTRCIRSQTPGENWQLRC